MDQCNSPKSTTPIFPTHENMKHRYTTAQTTANKLLCALQHSCECWATAAQVQPSFGEFLPVAQEQQHCMAEILNHRKHAHPVQIHLATETMQKRAGLQPLLT